MVLLKLVLAIFLALILLHIYKILVKPLIVEGLDNNSEPEYKDPGLSDDPKQGPLYLGTINASNITYLKGRVDQLQGLKEVVMDVSGHVHANSQAIAAINQQLINSADDVTGQSKSKTTVPM